MHRLSFSRKSSHAAAAFHRFQLNIKFFITKNNHQRSIPVAYNDVDSSIYGDSIAPQGEPETRKKNLQDTVLELSREKVLNFKLTELSQETVIKKLDFHYNDSPSSAKIIFSFGFVLQSLHNSDEFRCYHAAQDNAVFLNPIVLSDDSNQK